MISALCYRPNVAGHEEIERDEIVKALKSAKSLLWIDVEDPSDEDYSWLQETFKLHRLAVEHARGSWHRPSVDHFGDDLWISFAALSYGAAKGKNAKRQKEVKERQKETGTRRRHYFQAQRLMLFIGKNHVVTLRHDKINALEDLREVMEKRSTQDRTDSAGMLLYLILDTIVDDYFPVVDQVSEDMEAIEDRLFKEGGAESLEEILFVKKQLLQMRRMVAPERDLMSVLMRRDAPFFDEETSFYLQDVFDHLVRALDMIDSHREMLTSTMEAQLSITSNRLNQVMKTMTASSIILMTAALFVGAYGMNFARLPFSDAKHGFEILLLVMVLVSLSIFGFLYRIRWF